MGKSLQTDPLVSQEPEVGVDAATSRILKERVKSAGEGRTVSARAARQRIHQWITKSATTKKR